MPTLVKVAFSEAPKDATMVKQSFKTAHLGFQWAQQITPLSSMSTKAMGITGSIKDAFGFPNAVTNTYELVDSLGKMSTASVGEGFRTIGKPLEKVCHLICDGNDATRFISAQVAPVSSGTLAAMQGTAVTALALGSVYGASEAIEGIVNCSSDRDVVLIERNGTEREVTQVESDDIKRVSLWNHVLKLAEKISFFALGLFGTMLFVVGLPIAGIVLLTANTAALIFGVTKWFQQKLDVDPLTDGLPVKFRPAT